MQSLTIEEVEQCTDIFSLPFLESVQFVRDGLKKVKQFLKSHEEYCKTNPDKKHNPVASSAEMNRLLKAVNKLSPVVNKNNWDKKINELIFMKQIEMDISELEHVVSILKNNESFKDFSPQELTDVALRLNGQRKQKSDANNLIKSHQEMLFIKKLTDDSFQYELIDSLKEINSSIDYMSCQMHELHEVLNLRL